MEYLKNLDSRKKIVLVVIAIVILLLVVYLATKEEDEPIIEEPFIDYEALEKEAEIQIEELDRIREERGVTYTEEDIQRQTEELDQIREEMNAEEPALTEEEQQALIEQQIRELDEIRNSEL
jgi:uncharacterized protein YoxC